MKLQLPIIFLYHKVVNLSRIIYIFIITRVSIKHARFPSIILYIDIHNENLLQQVPYIYVAKSLSYSKNVLDTCFLQ